MLYQKLSLYRLQSLPRRCPLPCDALIRYARGVLWHANSSEATARNLQDKEELQRAMANKVPAKIDIGPIYNVDPQRRKAYTGEELCTTHMSLQ